MKGISVEGDDNVIVGIGGFDDAGVYRLTDEIAIIETLDFFTPIVDDPFMYGQIAASNALSDVYAMGGRPVTAMNIVCFPVNKFSIDVLGKILEGGLDIIKKAGVQLLGGHSVDDEEMKYGLSVTGVVHPDKVLRNSGLRDGDVIVLTKPLGTGIIATAIKADMFDTAHFGPYSESMIALNDKAAEIMQAFDVHACTDVTGFGLAGHLREMLAHDIFEISIELKNLPVLPGALDAAEMGLIPAGMYNNRDHAGSLCVIEPSVEQGLADIVFDPQTSGGLLIAVPGEQGERLAAELKSKGITDARVIASVKQSDERKIRLV